MPELRTHKRRPFPRLPIKCSPSLITEKEDARKKKNQTIAVGAMMVLFLFCSVNGYWIVADIQQRDSDASKRRTQKSNKVKSGTLKKPTKTRWSLGSFLSSSIRGPAEAEATLSPELIRKMEENMYSIAKILPEIAKIKTNASNFKERYKLFKAFYNSLSKGDQKALFPMVTIEKMDRFFSEDPKGASVLLDKLLKSVQMLIP